MINSKKINLLPFVLTLPALIVGVITMINNQVSPSIYGQNIIISILGGIISFFVLLKVKSIKKKTSIIVITCIFILFLLTFFDAGLYGVHRWLTIGPLRMNIAFVLAPLLIINLSKLVNSTRAFVTLSTIFAFTVMLFLQPDASQLTAFTISILFLYLNMKKNKSSQLLFLIVMILLIFLSWTHLDKLAPVPYVEDILSLAKVMGYGWLIIAILSLIILPLPFFLFPPSNVKLLSFSLGIYFSISILSSFFGNFPVPIMGYGTSPFIGYFIAMIWYVQKKNHH